MSIMSCPDADPADAAGVTEELQAAQVECDRVNIRLISAYLKSNKQARALEVVGCLHSLKSIQGECPACQIWV
jgi:hypothetical protein